MLREGRRMVWSTEPRWRTRHEAHYGRVVRCFAERPPNLDALLRRAAADFPAAEALVAGSFRLDYRGLDETVERVAGNLAAAGLQRGERIALLLGNRPEFLYVVLAAARLGAVSVPLNVRQRLPENAFALAQSGAAALVHEAELAPYVPAAAAAPQLRLRYALDGAVAGARPFEDLLRDARAPDVEVGEREVATILYTSGTTGRPKGAMLTHLGQLTSVLHFEMALGFAHGRERSVLAVPASHVTGLTAVLLAMLNVAGCTVLLPEFKAAAFLELAAAERMTHAIMVPAMYNLCLMQPAFDALDLSAWRYGGFGGAPMPTATIEALAARRPGLMLWNGYGATETTSPTACMPLGLTRGHEASVGHVLPCAEVRVMDEDGREVPPGEPGELWIAGAMTVPGYWDNPEATAANFTGGYWRSGDVGSIDRDGFVHVFDRRKDMINRAGYKVYCIEVENVLKQLDGIIEAAVVARPDPVLGERVQAFVWAEPAARDAEALRRFAAQRLSDYKVPDVVTWLDEPLPRNANGKVLKPALRERVAAELRGAGGAA